MALRSHVDVSGLCSHPEAILRPVISAAAKDHEQGSGPDMAGGFVDVVTCYSQGYP